MQAAPKLFNDVLAYTKTNLTMEQIIALAKFADGFDMDTINRYRVTGTGKTFGTAWMMEADMDGLYDFIWRNSMIPSHKENMEQARIYAPVFL